MTDKPKGQLVIVRHGESEYNVKGLWTGLTDVHTTAKGIRDDELIGLELRDIHFDIAFASNLARTHETLNVILATIGQADLPRIYSESLNERDYGIYTGENKWQVQEQIGEEAFQSLRRDWDYPVPKGETLKMVYDRAVPYYLQEILPRVMNNKTVLVAAHGNTIRALMKYIDKISDSEIANVEMLFDQILIYSLDPNGRASERHIRRISTKTTHA